MHSQGGERSPKPRQQRRAGGPGGSQKRESKRKKEQGGGRGRATTPGGRGEAREGPTAARPPGRWKGGREGGPREPYPTPAQDTTLVPERPTNTAQAAMPQVMDEEGARSYQRHTAPASTTGVDRETAPPPRRSSTNHGTFETGHRKQNATCDTSTPTPTTEVDIEVAPRAEQSPARRGRSRVQDSKGAPRVKCAERREEE